MGLTGGGRGRAIPALAGALIGALVLVREAQLPAAHATTAVGDVVVAVTAATNIAVCISPDRQRIVFGMHGGLWRMSAEGGQATLLTSPFLDPARPDWSPRGDRIAFEAYSGGGFHIWTMRPDGTDVRQVTFGHGDDREPRYSPDGTKIAFSSDRAFDGIYSVWVADAATGSLTRITSGPEDNYEPTWSPDGRHIAYISGLGSYGSSIRATGNDGTRVLITAPPRALLDSPSWAPNGEQLAYIQSLGNESRLVVSGRALPGRDDVFPFPAIWLNEREVLYAANGGVCISNVETGATRNVPFSADITLHRPPYERKRYRFDDPAPHAAKGIVSPALSPDGRRIVFEALNQLWLLDVGGTPRPLTHDAYYKENPAWSPDGRKIAYSSDKDGVESVYLLDLATGAERRLTQPVGSAEVNAAWAPDGRAVAYQDQTGATYVADIAAAKVRQVISAQFAPSKPSWCGSGKISMAVLVPYSRRFREGTNQILTVDVATGARTLAPVAPYKSIATRGEDGPACAPDAKNVAFIMDGVLWVQPLGPHGLPAGPPRAVTHESSDNPTWSGDSRHILYVSDGRLRILDLGDGATQTVPLNLTWQPAASSPETVIHVGQLWDGRGPDQRKDVDIFVEGGRIRHLEAHSDGTRAAAAARHARFVDASNLTAIPGLWESHTHHWISGQYYGARLGRLWLAYGVTSLHSQGDPAYRAVETREAFESGARVGPRFFVTGEPIDGERIYYGFMRPTTSRSQLALELSRAQALEYDSLKTYVRLPFELQRAAVEFAHEVMGIPVASHAMLPGMSYGMDGMTHIAATSRYGFRYTRSPSGVSYHGTRALLAGSGMFAISTPFSSSALYADDPTMVDDFRLTALNPSWEQDALRAKRTRAAETDQSQLLDALSKEEAVVTEVVRSGGTILAGSDSPLDDVATALQLNLRAEVKFGLRPWEALQTATIQPAKAFGVDQDLGTLEPGKLADIVLVSGDPLRDIRDAANVKAVMKAGRLFTVQRLVEPFEHKHGATAEGKLPSPHRQPPV